MIEISGEGGSASLTPPLGGINSSLKERERYIYVYIHTYIYSILAYIHTDVYVCMHVYVCMYMYVCIIVYVCMYMCICMCVCKYVCVCVCIYVYVLGWPIVYSQKSEAGTRSIYANYRNKILCKKSLELDNI